MKNMFPVLLKNLKAKPLTVHLPDEAPRPKNFRGPVKIEVGKCIGCGICAYVCASNAVQVTENEDSCEWRYQAGSCIFCGRCTLVCPGRALRVEAASAPAHANAGELDETHRVPYPACPECGRPSRPGAEGIMIRVYDGEPPEKVMETSLLCRRCRLRRSQTNLWATAGRSAHPKGGSPA